MIIQTISSGEGITFTQDGTDVSISSKSGFTANTCDMPIMANNSSDAANDIDFTEGFCYDLSTKEKIVSTAMTKQLDTTWAEGTHAGGLDTGSKANSTWYHCFAISKADGTSDFLFSTSVTAPTMPSGYVNKRRVGSIKTDSSGNIRLFTQDGDFVQWATPSNEIITTTPPTTFTDLIISAPLGIKTRVLLQTSLASSSFPTMVLKDKNSGLFTSVTSGLAIHGNLSFVDWIYTNTSSQIQHYCSLGSVTNYLISSIGYYDKRGVN